MKKLVLKRWVENFLILVCVFGLFLDCILEHNDITLYIYGTILIILSSVLLIKYGRD